MLTFQSSQFMVTFTEGHIKYLIKQTIVTGTRKEKPGKILIECTHKEVLGHSTDRMNRIAAIKKIRVILTSQEDLLLAYPIPNTCLMGLFLDKHHGKMLTFQSSQSMVTFTEGHIKYLIKQTIAYSTRKEEPGKILIECTHK